MPRNHKIRLRQGTSTPSAVDFEIGEPAWDRSAKKLYIKAQDGTMVEISSGSITSSGSVDINPVIAGMIF